MISAYEHFLEDSEAINQTSALQLIFDLRFVQTLLLLRESKVSIFHIPSSYCFQYSRTLFTLILDISAMSVKVTT